MWPALLERIDQGEPLREVAKAYGVSYTTIRNAEKAARQALGVPDRRQHSQWKIPPSEWPAILQRIDQGESLSQIAREYAVSRKAVQRVEKAARKVFNASERPPRYRCNIPPSEWSVILKRIDRGDTFNQIAKDYGVSETSVRRLEKEARRTLQAPERFPHLHMKLPPSEWSVILQRRKQGETFLEIAKSYHVSQATVRRVVYLAYKQNEDEK